MSRLLRSFLALALFISVAGFTPGAVDSKTQPTAVFVDTDIGVDDAVAIAWLLARRDAEVVGFTTVGGNTTVENATANLLTLLDVAGETDLPVTIGAASPLVFPLTGTGAFINGPDGLWFAQTPQDLSSLPTDAPAAIAAAARDNPDIILIALGPLTNFAQAVERFPEDLAGVRLVALSGAKCGGNRTAVAEFNSFVDPHAMQVVLDSDIEVELLPFDAFERLMVDATDFPASLASDGGPVGAFLAPVLTTAFQAQFGTEVESVSLPDAAMVIYALNSDLGETTSALVKVATDDNLTRGQTVIATDDTARLALIADDAELSDLAAQAFSIPDFDLTAALGAILAREPDNAQVIFKIKGRVMARLLERTLTR